MRRGVPALPAFAVPTANTANTDDAAAAASVDAAVRLLASDYNMIQNREPAKLVDVNLKRLGAIHYTDEQQAFARELQTALGLPADGVD